MVAKEDVKNILIIGIAGGLAQQTARRLVRLFPKAKLVGVDSRQSYRALKIKNLQVMRIPYSRNSFETIFRNTKFDLVFHLGRIPNSILISESSTQKRADFHVMGTNIILDLCLKFGVRKVIVLSTSYVYGALPDNPVFLSEEDPLRASLHHHDMIDVVDFDRISCNWMWKNRDQIKTVILRPCHIIGPNIKNTLNQYLTSEYSPVPNDYNPQMQFIDETDMVRVLTEGAEKLPCGVYNVAPDDFISLREAKALVGAPGFRTSFFIFSSLTKFFKPFGYSVPDYLVEYLKYSCLVDNTEIKKYLGESFFRYGVEKALKRL